MNPTLPRLMATAVLALFLSILVFTSPAAEDAPADDSIAGRYKAFYKKYAFSLSTTKDRDEQKRIIEERETALRDILADGAATDIKKLTFADCMALVDVAKQLRRDDAMAKYARVALDAEPKLESYRAESLWRTVIEASAREHDLAAAEASFKEALKRYPDSLNLKSYHMQMATFYRSERKHLQGAQHLEAYLTHRFEALVQRPSLSTAKSLTSSLDTMLGAFDLANAPDAALKALDGLAAVLQPATGDAIQSAELLKGEITARKVPLLASLKKQDEAGALLKEEMAAARKLMEADKNNTSAVLRMAALLRTQAEVESQKEDAPKAATRADLDFLTEQVRARPNQPELIEAYADTVLGTLTRERRAGGENIGDLVKSANETLSALKPEDKRAQGLVERTQKQLAMYARAMEQEKAKDEMVGKPALPLEVISWANGQPLTDSDLKGKVVMLDFWAVWCGPCVATFPHLRELHEKYADKGLVIIGLTHHYGLGWDGNTKRSKQVEDLAPAQEDEALGQFARHHNLHHVFGITPQGGSMDRGYGVSGIPHVVVIDRKGIVRLTRTGAGGSNARDIEEMIKKLLAE